MFRGGARKCPLFSNFIVRRGSSMPKYFFSQMCPDRTMSDVFGEELEDRRQAADRARELARELASEQLQEGRGPTGWVEVEDENRRPLFMLPLRAVAS
jgi:hypothetical protein